MDTDNKLSLSTVSILGAELTVCTKRDLLTLVADCIRSGSNATILSGNVHSLNLAYEMPWFRELLSQADVVRVDGAGLRLAGKLLGHDMPERATWADFIWDLAQFCNQQDLTVFLLGARPGVADRAAAYLKGRFPALRVLGTHHGYFDKTASSSENEAVIQAINAVKPDILVVAFGMPLQERWLWENRERLDAKVVFTCGAMFDYVSGELRRPPRWMTDHGLEWLGRLLIEPRRLWRRYLIGNPLFLWRVLKQRLGLLRFK
jgi:N-acetylglucosaminyldiphosphoundecaprenol N-acetyl-beta-D-mannosaminyltransferase